MPLDPYSITLAAGSGSRMPGDMPPKPCCKIGPLSVIENALQTYEQAGIHRHVVVVGYDANSVMDAVCRTRPDVLFAYQRELGGTGDAVRCGLDLLASVGPPQDVLICAGDKVVEPRVIRGLLGTYTTSGCDLCLAAGRSDHYTGSGRIIVSGDRVVGIIEVPDVAVSRIATALRSLPQSQRPSTVGGLAELVSRDTTRTGRLSRCFPALGAILERPKSRKVSWDEVAAAAETVPEGFDLPGGTISADQAAAAELGNLSVYVGRFGLLRDMVHRLGTNNVQGECYFTDVVEAVARRGHAVGIFRVNDPEDVMAFNTQEQLEEVRKVHTARALTRTHYPKAQAWAQYFAQRPDMALHADAVKGLIARTGPDRPCVVACSPGRINLMGRHIDHQGGVCNLMAVDRHIVIAASPRSDDVINLWDSHAPGGSHHGFRFGELAGGIAQEHSPDSQFLDRLVAKNADDWARYVKDAAARLQQRFRDRALRGVDAFLCGNIPAGAGLSASSALVVAVSEVLTELNGLNVRPREFVDLCGEAGWFVGAGAGSGDYAPAKPEARREVISVSFFPFEILARHAFPQDCRLVVCHSGLPVEEAAEVKERLRARIACYHIACEIIRREFPEAAPRIRHLRDVNTRTLDVSLPTLYALLKRLPTVLGAEEVQAFAAEHPVVAKCLAGLDLGRHEFRPRDVALYGLAECERALRAGSLLERDAAGLGQVMNVSHDGDRVTRWNAECAPFENQAGDEHMDSLIERASQLRPLTESGAALWQQPGACRCSMPRMDLLVDRALACPGVLGAQLAGAGVGGCIMVLARSDSVAPMQGCLRSTFYEPEGVEPRMFVCRPSQESYVLTSVETL